MDQHSKNRDFEKKGVFCDEIFAKIRKRDNFGGHWIMNYGHVEEKQL